MTLDSNEPEALCINTEHKEHTRLVVISYVCSLNLFGCRANMCFLDFYLKAQQQDVFEDLKCDSTEKVGKPFNLNFSRRYLCFLFWVITDSQVVCNDTAAFFGFHLS